jgi:Carboxypeptidase regulatory-like domain
MPNRPTKNENTLLKYSLISFIVFLCFGALLHVFIADAEKLSRFGLSVLVYFLILVVLGLGAAVFLFGVLQSSGRWTGKVLGGKLSVSGAIVGAALVVAGGYWFIPKMTFFPLTVYVRGEGGSQDIVLRSTGRVSLKLGAEISSEAIGENGQAVFPHILADFRGQRVPGWVESEDYETPQNSTVLLAGSDIDLIVKKKVKHFKLGGAVLDPHNNPLPEVRITVPEYHLNTTTDNDGRFELEVTADREKMTDLRAEKRGYQTANFRATLGDTSVNFILERDR